MVRKQSTVDVELSEIFVRRVREEIQREGINIRQLAIKCGKPAATLNLILNGKNDCSITIASLIAEALDVELSSLLCE